MPYGQYIEIFRLINTLKVLYTTAWWNPLQLPVPRTFKVVRRGSKSTRFVPRWTVLGQSGRSKWLKLDGHVTWLMYQTGRSYNALLHRFLRHKEIFVLSSWNISYYITSPRYFWFHQESTHFTKIEPISPRLFLISARYFWFHQDWWATFLWLFMNLYIEKWFRVKACQWQKNVRLSMSSLPRISSCWLQKVTQSPLKRLSTGEISPH